LADETNLGKREGNGLKREGEEDVATYKAKPREAV